ncbi:hypothetical protein LTR27_012526 [Elasticomyces elasticus]|nr:hypothetical protein LTR27_012526 [Elasticomyces elasticus]
MAMTLVDMSTSIVYPVLNAKDRQIRLLTFGCNDNGQISGNFTVVSLDQPPQYTALSYLWGSETPDCLMWIDGRPFWVRPGLFAYLQLAAAENTVGEGIFIDAICINQADVAEKSSQIALMGSVYEIAFQVTSWFGDGGQRVSRLVEKYPAILDPAVLHACLVREATVYLSLGDAEEVRTAVRLHLLPHEYWGRVWTAQEFILPSRLVLRVGGLRIDVASWFAMLGNLHVLPRDMLSARSMMASAARRNSDVQSSSAYHSDARDYDYTRCNNFAVGRIAKADTAQLHNGLLFRAILHFSEQECFVAQDGLFALLGLCRSSIVPDYTAPVITLYIQALFEGLGEIRNQYGGDSNNLEICKSSFIASLLSSLGLRLEHPAVFLVTQMAFDPTSALTVVSIEHVFQLNMDLWHSQPNRVLLCNNEQLELLARSQSKAAFWMFFRNVKENGRVAGLEGESRTFAEWVDYVDHVLRDLADSQRRTAGRLDEGGSVALHHFWRDYLQRSILV